MASRKVCLGDNVEPFDIGKVERELRLDVPYGVEDQTDLTYKEP
jgi:hypothetical protein